MAVAAGPTHLHVEQNTDEAKTLQLRVKKTGEAFDLTLYESFDFMVKADVDDDDATELLFSYTGDGATGDIRYPSGETGVEGRVVVQFDRVDTATSRVAAWKLRGTLSGPRYEVLAKGNLTVGNN